MKIAGVSEKFGLSSDTLRYYERIGLIQVLPPNPYRLQRDPTKMRIASMYGQKTFSSRKEW